MQYINQLRTDDGAAADAARGAAPTGEECMYMHIEEYIYMYICTCTYIYILYTYVIYKSTSH